MISGPRFWYPGRAWARGVIAAGRPGRVDLRFPGAPGPRATVSDVKRFLDVDLLAGLGSIGFGVAGQWVAQLAALVSPPIAVAFGMMALGRWYNRHRPRKALPGAAAAVLLLVLSSGSGCSNAPRLTVSDLLAHSDAIADHAAEAWSAYVDHEIVRCRDLGLESPVDRRSCLGRAGDGDGFEDALEILVGVQSAAYSAAVRNPDSIAEVAALGADLTRALAALRPYLDAAEGTSSE